MEKTLEQTSQLLVSKPAKKTEAKLFKRVLFIFPLSLLAAVVVLAVAYVLFMLPILRQPISEVLSTERSPQKPTIEAYHQAVLEEEKEEILAEIDYPKHLEQPPLFIPVQSLADTEKREPVCSNQESMVFLLVGIDAKVDSYRAGLADVIRLIRIDFVNKQINMIALPRDMMVDFPEGRTSMQSPMKINQTYTMGTEAVQRYAGGGNGAHSLAEAIDYNFGVSVDHYAVVNFRFVINLIDAVGGIDVDLPQEVEDDYFGYYPAGPQHLDGLESLVLMRIRMKYNDDFRVSNQTLVLKAMFSKMKQPNMMLKIPGLVSEFRNNLLTDLSVEEIIKLGNCLMTEFDTEDINAKQFTSQHIQADRELIPSMNLYLFVYRWGDEAVQYIHDTLMGR